ncbi:CsbD family protein [Novosphingobium sp. Leaf2]|uniref:CsbD family protein n=1 Tax=Novosphingobium sp. Leaf2 TaxID=1735670 RepID=UPI0006F357F9|nr:CsbD family protein [Novosphingobium sp. Leaf2]KQM22064.1 hypothetical protein ASE49_01795 [Novosphingobium sp. Leaf2]
MTAPHNDDDIPGDSPDDKAKAAAAREVKGSVKEAIGKLLGDDDVRARGAAEKKAAAKAASHTPHPSPRAPR